MKSLWTACRSPAVLAAAVLIFSAVALDQGSQARAQAVDGSEGAVTLRLRSFDLMLDPLRMADVDSRRVGTLLYAPLVAVDQDGTVHGRLAESWEKIDGGWRFTLADGVTFSNGQPVTATDVVASLCRSMQPTSPWNWTLAAVLADDDGNGGVTCSGLKAPHEDEVRILVSNEPDWFLEALASPAGWITPADQGEAGPYGVRPGAGPYVVEAVKPDHSVVLTARTDGVPAAGAARVVFRLMTDDNIAAAAFRDGTLDVIDLDSPQLVDLLTEERDGQRLPVGSAVMDRRPWDRVRIAVVNRTAFADKGLSEAGIANFIRTFSESVDRAALAALSNGTAQPLHWAFLPAARQDQIPPGTPPGDLSVPDGQGGFSVVTEPDPYSDLIAAALPDAVGGYSKSYRGLAKGLLIQAVVSGEYDVASLVIEATISAPEFWASFFTPGNPLTVFGTALEGMRDISLDTTEGVTEAAHLIAEEGNWIPLLVESRVQLRQSDVSGIRFTPTGQDSYEGITRP